MTFTLEKVVPWGRSYDEYLAMFALADSDLNKKILGCSDGPAGFNAELTGRGGRMVSVDPLYAFSVEEIRGRIDATYDEVVEQVRKNRDQFVWKQIESVEALAAIRMEAMGKFLSDFPAAKGRYVNGSLPSLPFADNEFDLAICSHFLFLYSEQLSLEFHLQSIKELCRVAAEVRIFPLLELNSQKSRHLDKIITLLEAENLCCRIQEVAYEFQKGGNQLLQTRKSRLRNLGKRQTCSMLEKKWTIQYRFGLFLFAIIFCG